MTIFQCVLYRVSSKEGKSFCESFAFVRHFRCFFCEIGCKFNEKMRKFREKNAYLRIFHQTFIKVKEEKSLIINNKTSVV